MSSRAELAESIMGQRVVLQEDAPEPRLPLDADEHDFSPKPVSASAARQQPGVPDDQVWLIETNSLGRVETLLEQALVQLKSGGGEFSWARSIAWATQVAAPACAIAGLLGRDVQWLLMGVLFQAMTIALLLIARER